MENYSLNPHTLQISVLLTVRHLAPIYAIYRLLRYNDIKLSLGPFFVLSNLHILAMIIQTTKVTKTFTDDLTAQLLFGVVFMLTYLIRTQQYAQIVYQVTILINISWSVRQQTIEDINLWCLAFQYLVSVSPLYNIYKAIKEKDDQYINVFCMYIYALECTIWIVSCLISREDQSILDVYPPILKFILVFIMLRVYWELNTYKKSKPE